MINEALKAAWNDNTVRVSDSPLTLLVQAYRWHRYYACGNVYPRRGPNPATEAIESARRDMAAGMRRYPANRIYPAVSWQSPAAPHDAIGTWASPFPAKRERLGHVEKPANAGLRLVGEVMPECGGRNGIWDTRGDCGWHTDPGGDVSRDKSGLCYGVVYQLPGRAGRTRFVAGYEFGGCDGGPTLDFGTIYEGEFADNCSYDGAQGNPAARRAASAADDMAKDAAEKERDYQAAWQAGSRYADLARDVQETRQSVRDLLLQRREAMKAFADAVFPNGRPALDKLCAAVKHDVAGLLVDIEKARVTMRRLAEGEHVADYLPGFYANDSRLQAAFCEGANIDAFPSK